MTDLTAPPPIRSSGQRVPLIGVTASRERAVEDGWDNRYALVPDTYVTAVSEAGGIPLLLPPQPFDDAAIARVLDAIDALVLSGGADVDPGMYGAARSPQTESPRPDRDAWERALLLAALDRGLPVLAICRGVQLMNAALGGTLHQHLPLTGAADHGSVPGHYVPTEVRVAPGSRLGTILGADVPVAVHCHHHQALDRIAPGLVVVARSTDGVVEAVEFPHRDFAVGVQWHPEQHATDRRLFAALLAVATS